MLIDFMFSIRATSQQLQSLVDKLNAAVTVVCGGRVFLRRLLPHLNIRRTKADIIWWHPYHQCTN